MLGFHRDGRSDGEQGMAMVVVLLILLLVTALTGTIISNVDLETWAGFNASKGAAGVYAAEAGLNLKMAEVKNTFLSFQLPTVFTEGIFSLNGRTVFTQLIWPPAQGPVNTGRLEVIPPGDDSGFGGLNSETFTYEVSSKAQQAGFVQANLLGRYDVRYIPMFQFFYFYSMDFPAQPGAPRDIIGRIHSNGNMYLTTSNSCLRIWRNVTFVGDLFRRHVNGSPPSGRVWIDTDTTAPTGNCLNAGTISPPSKELPTSLGTAPVPDAKIAEWNGRVKRVANIAMPDPGFSNVPPAGHVCGSATPEPYPFWCRADLRLALRWPPPAGSLASIEVLNPDGTVNGAATAALNTFITTHVPTTHPAQPITYSDLPLVDCSNSDGTIKAGPRTAAPTTERCRPTPTPDQSNDVWAGYSATAAPPPFSDPYALAPAQAYYRRGGFFNPEEQRWMVMFNINVAALIDYNRTCTPTPACRIFDLQDFAAGTQTDAGLVIFATVLPSSGPINAYSVGGANNFGIRLFGSAELPTCFNPSGGFGTNCVNDKTQEAGLMLASDQGVWMQGNFNTTFKKRAAVVTDNHHWLSNAWAVPGQDKFSDRRIGGGPGNCNGPARIATTTTYNFGLLRGALGFRAYENWSNADHTQTGSIIQLRDPVHLPPPFVGSRTNCIANFIGIYRAHRTRVQTYDTDFDTFNRLPPLTPRFVSVRQLLFTQQFR